jgi:hypothetical protein
MPGMGNAVKTAATNDPTARINALDEPFRNMWPDGEPGIEYDEECKMCIAGLRSKYRYTRIKTTEGTLKDAPDKNNWSHVVEADQYGTLFILSKSYDPSQYVRKQKYVAPTQGNHRPADSYTGY